jgi:hypothetical protein
MPTPPDAKPDRNKWNQRWAAAAPSFTVHPLLEAALAAAPPPGAALELAAGPSGMALALAAAGREVTAVDISDIALAQLQAEAARRTLTGTVHTLVADLDTWTPARSTYALVLTLRFWDAQVFARACAAVMPGGLLAWETFTLAELRYRPSFSSAFCLAAGEPGSRLPDDFQPIVDIDLDDGHAATRRLIARRRP